MTFFAVLPSVHKSSERESHPMLQPLYLFNFTGANKELFNVKSLFKSLEHVSRDI